MQVAENVTRVERTIGATEGPTFTVLVPQPYSAGSHELTAGEASALNQTIAENLSNNLRKKLVEGNPDENDRAWTAEEAQAIVDKYLEEYEIGVRRAGSGAPRVTDPVEREARKIARQKAVAYIKENGGKPSDFDLDPIIEQIFEANRELLMAEGKKIVKAAEAAREKTSSLDLSGVSLAPAAEEEETETENA